MKKVWNTGKGWQRTQTKRGFVYRHNGKFTSEKAFKRSVASRQKVFHDNNGKFATKAKSERVKKLRAAALRNAGKRKGNWRKLAKLQKVQKLEKPFCVLKTREDFYNQVLADKRALTNKIGEERGSAIQLWFQIGDGEERRKTSDKRLQYTHGLRKFTRLQKARLFLGIDGVLTSGDKPLPKWKKRGKESVCTFEKKAWLVESRINAAGRALKPKILKKYIIQE